ncbi:MAG TPA: GAF domain-containing protein [Anaeromyxobacteraceae bacterium]|nr:GAF domain-containing protein [Anaeromyxobacteraceae bacterium]
MSAGSDILLDAAPIPTLVLRDRCVARANRAALDLLGLAPEEALGRNFLAFVAPEDAAMMLDRQERRLRGEPVTSTYEATLVFRGRRRRVRVHAAVSDGSVVVQLVDITGEGARRMRLAALAQLGALVQRQLREEDVLRTVRDALEALGLESAILEPSDAGIEIQEAFVVPERRERIEAHLGATLVGALLPWTPPLRQAWTNGAAFVDDWLAEARRLTPGALSPEDEAAATRLAGACVRVDLAGHPAALIYAVGPWLRPEDLPAFRLFGAQISGALQAARAVDELSRRNAELDALNRVGEAAGTAPELDAFLDRACREVGAAVGATAVGVYLFDDERAEARLLHLCGVDERFREALALRPIADFAPVGAGDVHVRHPEDHEPALRAELERAGVATAVSVPIRFRSSVVGALTVAYAERRAPAACRTELLQAMGAHFAAAAETHRLLGDLRRRVSELTLLNDIAAATAALDPVLLLENALRRISTTFGADAAAAYVVEGTEFTEVAAHGLGADGERPRRMSLAAGEVGRAFAERKTVAFPDLSRTMPPSAVHLRQGLLAGAAVPLVVKDRVLGALLLGRRRLQPFRADELALLAAIGVQLAVAVENARLFADTRRRVSDLEAVNALALHVFRTAPGDARALLEEACREIARALQARSAVVLQLDASREALTGAAGWGTPLPPAELAIPLSRSDLAGRALRTREPTWGLHVLDAPAPGERAPPPLSLLCLPLTARGSTRGLVVVADQPQRRYGDAEIALASALASEVAVGLENAELYAEARRRVEELSLLNEVGRTVAASLDLQRVLSDGARAVRQILGATHGHVLLLDPERRELRLGATTREGYSPLLSLREAVSASTLPAAAVRERRPVMVSDTEDPGPYDVDRARASGVRALLAAPLLVRDEPVGVLLVSQYDTARRFTTAEVERVMAVANQLAVAIENARLYDETRKRAEELGLLLEVGRSLVATLELDEVLDAGVRNLARIVQASDAFLFLADEGHTRLVCRAAASANPQLVGRALPLDGSEPSLAAEVFRGGQPLVVENAADDPRVNPGFSAVLPGQAHVALPLLVRDRRIGAAVLVDTRAPRQFAPAEVERAAAIANQLAVAVEHARLYEDLRRSYADLRRAQDQLVHRERLAALGELASVVAHEVRNPLGVIFNSLGSLRRMLRPEGDAKMLLDIVGEEADRLNRIIGDLLDFARPTLPTLRPEALDRVLDEALSAALAQARGPIDVRREVAPDLPLAPVDARLLRQALVNVVMNAVQAMPDGGPLAVRARAEGGFAVLEVEDAGPGIPEEVRHRIFEPFFTTKATGTGLGLAVVKRIVDGHRGRIEVSAAPGGGTRFALHLPIAPLDAQGGTGRGWVP